MDNEAAGKIMIVPETEDRSMLVLRGRLGTADARPLWELALRLTEGNRDLTLDCRELEQIGGAPLQVILALRTNLRERGKGLTVTGISPSVARALALAGLSADLSGT